MTVYASVLFALPSGVTHSLWLAGRIYVVVAIGLMAVGLTTVIVDTLDGISQRYAQRRNRLRHYEHLRALLPTSRACLEYALWVPWHHSSSSSCRRCRVWPLGARA